MTIEVRVRPGATHQKVEKLTDGVFKVWVTEPPEGDKANSAVVVLVAGYFGVPETHVQLVRGKKSRHKIIHIDTNLHTV